MVSILFAWQHLHVGHPRVVITTYVQHLIALTFVPAVANAVGPMPHFAEVGQFLCIQMEKIPRSLMLVAVGRLLLSESAGQGCSGLAQPETHRGPGNSKLCSDPDRHLAPPSSTYGLDDEAKLMASRQTVEPAGAVTEPGIPTLTKAPEPLVTGPLTEARKTTSFNDCHPRTDPINK